MTLFPTPHFYRQEGGTLALGPEVDNPLFGRPAIDGALERLLTGDGTGRLVLGTLENPGAAGAYFAKIPEASSAWRSHWDGYRLSIAPEENTVCLLGQTERGLFCGLQTLLAFGNDLPGAYLEDYADLPIRGVVEGFYGFPWSWENRRELISWAARQKMNTYVYAPKDDPYHRARWRELYPAAEQQALRALAETAKENYVNFVWALHPGESMDLDSDEDFVQAISKLEQLYSLGIRQFGVFFDDISEEKADGAKQAAFLNRLDDGFAKPKGDVGPLLTVGTRYAVAWGPEGYFKPFAENLHDDIEVMWTGENVCSPVNHRAMEWPIQEAGRKPLLWLNYPVNDYAGGKLLMGRQDFLGPDLDNVTGLLSNPMPQVHASMPAIFSLGDYAWNIRGFDAQRSFEASFEAVLPQKSGELAFFAQNVSGLHKTGMDCDESWDFAPLLEAYEKAPQETASKLEGLFARLEESCRVLMKEKVSIVNECLPWLKAALALSQAGRLLMKNPAEKQKARELLDETYPVSTIYGDTPAEAGMGRLRPFLEGLLAENPSCYFSKDCI